MTTTYLHEDAPRDAELIQLGAVYGKGDFAAADFSATHFFVADGAVVTSGVGNGQPAISEPVRILEETCRYIACRCQPAMGGSVRVSTHTASANWYYKIGTYPLGAETTIRVLVSSTDTGNTIYATSDTAIPSRTYAIPASAGAADPRNAALLTIQLSTAPQGTPSAPGVESLYLVMTRTAGTVYMWSQTIDAVPRRATHSLEI